MAKKRKKSARRSAKPLVLFSMNEETAKGIGISAIVCALLAFVIPVYGFFVAMIGVSLAVIAALAGDRIFATATAIATAINFCFASPLLWIMIYDQKRMQGNATGLYLLLFVLVAAPFIAMWLHSNRKVMIKRV